MEHVLTRSACYIMVCADVNSYTNDQELKSAWAIANGYLPALWRKGNVSHKRESGALQQLRMHSDRFIGQAGNCEHLQRSRPDGDHSGHIHTGNRRD
jgi:hypothetical protein